MGKRSLSARTLFETASLGAPENAIGFVLWRLVHRYQRELERELASVNLTHLQFQTLALCAWLSQSSELVTQSQLARAGDIQPMQVSYMLKALEDKGFVARRAHSSDPRAKRVAPTAAGLRVLRQAFPLAIEVQRRLFGSDGVPGGSLHSTLLQLLQDEQPSVGAGRAIARVSR